MITRDDVVKALDAIDTDIPEFGKSLIKGSGAGSRGGKVVGKTRSGKPIYERANHTSFNGKDHYDAAAVKTSRGDHAGADDHRRALAALEKKGDDSASYDNDSHSDEEFKALGKKLSKSVSTSKLDGDSKEDLNSANGAADGSSGDGKDLSAPGEDMNAAYGNNKKKGKDGAMKSRAGIPEDFNKSLPPAVETKVEVSDFLKSLVDHNAGCMDSLRDAVIKSGLAAEDRMEEVMEQVEELQKAQGNVGIVLKAICERIGIVENKPAQIAKSTTAIQSGTVIADRQFADPQGGAEASQDNGQGMYKSLAGKSPDVQKSVIANGIMDLVKKGDAADTDVINFETYNYLSPEIDSKLRAVL